MCLGPDPTDPEAMSNLTLHPKPGHAALRRGRVAQPGQIYLVTFTTHGRQPLFADPSLAMVAAPLLADARRWRTSAVLAWVLMPDHWHGLVELGAGDTLARVVRDLKVHTARVVRAARPATRVWARGYHDHAVRTDEVLRDVARYVVMNPVRAGLVRRAGDYPYWDAAWL